MTNEPSIFRISMSIAFKIAERRVAGAEIVNAERAADLS